MTKNLLDQVISETVATLSGAASVAPVAAPAPIPTIVATARSTPTVDKEFLLRLLNNPATRMHTVGRALVVLFNRQTATERADNQTKTTNNRGFTQADAYRGTMAARSYLKNKSLQDWQVNQWMKLNAKGEPRIVKYWRQLDEAAKEKASS